MLTNSCTVNKFMLGYCDMLMAEIPDDRMCEQPSGLNHPAWILGHLALTGDYLLKVLGGAPQLDESWNKLFGMGSQPTGNRADYPAKEELVTAVRSTYTKACELAGQAKPEILNAPNQSERMKGGLPTMENVAAFLLSAHFTVHLGQLSAWRRAQGMPGV